MLTNAVINVYIVGMLAVGFGSVAAVKCRTERLHAGGPSLSAPVLAGTMLTTLSALVPLLVVQVSFTRTDP